jgi:hypothetical protein
MKNMTQDKYDRLVESEIDFRDEGYFYSIDPYYNDKEAQERLCWEMKKKRYFTEYP